MESNQEELTNKVKSKILVVDDDVEINKFLKTLLNIEGFYVDTSLTGMGALDLVNKNPYDLIVLDIGLPDINGIELGKKIKEELNMDIPICIITAQAEVQNAIDAFAMGVEGYVVKPFEIDELLKKIQSILKI